MTYHELIKKRIELKKQELKRMKTLGKFLLRTPDYNIDKKSLNQGCAKLKRLTKDKLIRRLMTYLDIIYYNEMD